VLLGLFWHIISVGKAREIRITGSRDLCGHNLFETILSSNCTGAYPLFSSEYDVYEQNPLDEPKACFVKIQQTEELYKYAPAIARAHTYSRTHTHIQRICVYKNFCSRLLFLRITLCKRISFISLLRSTYLCGTSCRAVVPGFNEWNCN
jgi:hypothetical protein